MRVRNVAGNAEWLKVTDLDNFFSVYKTVAGEYAYNLNSSLYVTPSGGSLKRFTCDCEMHWPLISYRIYGTTRLAWLLLALNGVKLPDMF